MTFDPGPPLDLEAKAVPSDDDARFLTEVRIGNMPPGMTIGVAEETVLSYMRGSYPGRDFEIVGRTAAAPPTNEIIFKVRKL